MGDIEFVDTKHNDCEKNGAEKKNVGKLRQLPLKRSPLSETKEFPDCIPSPHGGTLDGIPLALLGINGAAGLLDLVAHRSGDGAHLGTHSGSDNDTPGTSFGDFGAGKGHVEPVTASLQTLDGFDLFDNGQRLSCEDGFEGGKVVCFENANVGRHDVSGSQLDDVSRYDGSAGDDFVVDVAVAEDGGRRTGKTAQIVYGFLSVVRQLVAAAQLTGVLTH